MPQPVVSEVCQLCVSWTSQQYTCRLSSTVPPEQYTCHL